MIDNKPRAFSYGLKAPTNIWCFRKAMANKLYSCSGIDWDDAYSKAEGDRLLMLSSPNSSSVLLLITYYSLFGSFVCSFAKRYASLCKSLSFSAFIIWLNADSKIVQCTILQSCDLVCAPFHCVGGISTCLHFFLFCFI